MRGPFVSAPLIFKGAAIEGLSNGGGYLPDFTVSNVFIRKSDHLEKAPNLEKEPTPPPS